MSHDTIEPLEPGTWLLQLRTLAARRPVDERALVALLRRSYHLVQLTPRPLRHVVVCRAAESEFEQWLEDGALLEAGQALLGERFTHSLGAADADGMIEAEVRFAGGGAFGNGSASSAPLALFAAWLECLLRLTEPRNPGRAAVRGSLRLPDPRRSRSAPHPKPTEH